MGCLRNGASGPEGAATGPVAGNEGPGKLVPDLETPWSLPGWVCTFGETSDSFSFPFLPFVNQNI